MFTCNETDISEIDKQITKLKQNDKLGERNFGSAFAEANLE